ncbi:hypothetical protein Scep_010735 [Stephania cephalantha]|uniref:Uncharacterized protein n=1 Tax=Stephania cephalantha TaxID=152367 RepID=A0AAP0PFJ2_9MAGN
MSSGAAASSSLKSFIILGILLLGFLAFASEARVGVTTATAVAAAAADVAHDPSLGEQKINIGGEQAEIRHERKLGFFSNLGNGLLCVAKGAVGLKC